MKRLLLLFFLIASAAHAQSTIVSGTVTDATSQPFSNGTYRIEFDPNGVAPPFQWNGAPFDPSAHIFTGMLNAFGAFSGVTVPSNPFINPGTQWKFTVCPSSSSPCYAKSLVVAGATLNVSTILTPPAILVQSQDYSQATAYADSEIGNPKVGFKYFNLTDQKDHTCTIAIPCTWVVGPGGSGGVLSVGCENLFPLFTCFVNNATTTPDINYVLSNAAANTVFANCTASSAAPSYCSINVAMLPVNIPNANLQNSSTTVNGQPCALGGSCTITIPGSGTSGAQFSPQYSSDGAGGHAGISPPTTNGQYDCGFNVTGSAAVAPTCPQLGVSNVSIAGASSTFTFTYAHNAEIITHDAAGSQVVAVTLPLASTLGNSNYITSYCNYSSHTDVITPTTATINGSSTLNVPTSNCERIHPDPNSSGNWLADTTSPSSGGTVTSVTGTPPIASSGGNTPAISCTTCLLGSSLGAGVVHAPGASQTMTSSAVVSADLNITTTSCTNQVVSAISATAVGTCHTVVGGDMASATVTATQLAAQYSKGSCTELWGGSGTSFALTSGDDAISNNSCYNDSGVTRTITAVKCRSDNASNTTTVNPTFGAAGTGTTILSGALTCGSSLAYSSTGTVSNASWTTGTGITPAMSGTLTGTSIAMIVEYTY